MVTRTFKTGTLKSAQLAAPAAVRLEIVDGVDRGRSWVLKEGTALVGTHADCQLVLTDGAVSRRHLTVRHLGDRLEVEDQGSKNGTRYLGAKIQRVQLQPGAQVVLGRSVLALGQPQATTRSKLFDLLGKSEAMRRCFEELERVGKSDSAVFITGETGTGKELVARAIHQSSSRAKGPFIVFDCGMAQSELLQSALFGHVKGAFTGAVAERKGALELAHKGTLFLDEIAELPVTLQPVLLRALETRMFTRLGEARARASDFRILAASHHNLGEDVAAGKFREDLYHRLVALTVRVPALRERVEDIPLLAESFAAPRALTPTQMSSLCAYRWPGNVRELRNAVERLLTMGTAQSAEGSAADFHASREAAIEAFEKSYLKELLARTGSPSAAAKEAGLARSYFYRLLKHHGLS
jgi:DNA-binding NtrC family response regulator